MTNEYEVLAAEDSAAFQEAVNAPYQPSARPIPMDRTASAISSENLEGRFTFHELDEDQRARCAAVRQKGREFAELVLSSSKTSREQSVALTHIEDVVHWANKGIARNG